MYCLYHLTGETRPNDPEGKNLLSLRIFLKEGVQGFIFKGADLMWPGVAWIESSKGFTEYNQEQHVVIFAFNGFKQAEVDDKAEEKVGEDEETKESVSKVPIYVPVATGRMVQ